MGKGLSRPLFVAFWGGLIAAAALLLAGVGSSGQAGADAAEAEPRPPHDAQDEQTNPLGANAGCYVCHIPFVREELSKVHLKAEVACVRCHGLSAGHANDEDIGATPPDVVFRRGQVDAMCADCHRSHRAPARLVIARFLQRRLMPESAPVCTDCHGTHRIQRSDRQERR